jgi:excisionase family DNA binding protein
MPAPTDAQSPTALLTYAEVAAELQVPEHTVKKLVLSGKIRRVFLAGNEKRPRHLRVSRADLDRYLASLAAPPACPPPGGDT